MSRNFVIIGLKPIMNYVVACVTFFNQGVNNISLKARGRAISKTIDTVELLKRAFVKDLIVKNINIGDEVVLNPGLSCGACEYCKSGGHISSFFTSCYCCCFCRYSFSSFSSPCKEGDKWGKWRAWWLCGCRGIWRENRGFCSCGDIRRMF